MNKEKTKPETYQCQVIAARGALAMNCIALARKKVVDYRSIIDLHDQIDAVDEVLRFYEKHFELPEAGDKFDEYELSKALAKAISARDASPVYQQVKRLTSAP